MTRSENRGTDARHLPTIQSQHDVLPTAGTGEACPGWIEDCFFGCVTPGGSNTFRHSSIPLAVQVCSNLDARACSVARSTVTEPVPLRTMPLPEPFTPTSVLPALAFVTSVAMRSEFPPDASTQLM